MRPLHLHILGWTVDEFVAMERRDAVILLLLLSGGVYYGSTHWEEIKEKLGLDDLTPGRIKAIELTKQQFTFDRYRQNGILIQERTHSGEILCAQDPWQAQRVRDNHFIVVCSFREDGKDHHRRFEVDVGSGAVVDLGEAPTPPLPVAKPR